MTDSFARVRYPLRSCQSFLWLLMVVILMGCGEMNQTFAQRQAVPKGTFFLTDQKTQMPVLCLKLEPHWVAGGKTAWLSSPAQPFVWKAWALDRQSGIKSMVVSSLTFGMNGMIQQQPLLQNAEQLANLLRTSIQEDYLLKDLQLKEATYVEVPNALQTPLMQKNLQQAQQRGILIANAFFKNFLAQYECVIGGKKYNLIYRIPVLALESRTAMTASTTIELTSMLSYCCPPGQEATGWKQLEQMAVNIQVNQNFMAMVSQMSNQRTASWVAMQNQIRERQFQAQQSMSSSGGGAGSATNDGIMDLWSEHIKDVDSLKNPNTGEQMFVDRQYDHAWINSDNEIMYNNSADFDPNRDPHHSNSSWSKLK